MTLKDVLYMPEFHKNIVSLGVIIRDGFELSVTGSTMTVKKGSGGHISFNRETKAAMEFSIILKETARVMPMLYPWLLPHCPRGPIVPKTSLQTPIQL
jgi:hypothetical protein